MLTLLRSIQSYFSAVALWHRKPTNSTFAFPVKPIKPAHSSSPISLLAPCRRHQKYIAQIMLSAYLFAPGVLLAQGATAAINSAHAPAFDTSASGIPIVNINAPSAKGVSRNEYDQLNVEKKGLIFNNATDITNTELAGYIDGNARLGGKSASIILNEVTGNSRSALNGYMEIAGQSAEMIIANQNGITCNGCGFINTTRATLTTGQALFDGAGGLSGFDVSQGDIAITGDGLNDTQTRELDILARSVRLNAKLWADQATIITGDNRINYQDKSVTARSNDERETFALDVAAIGGMYANRIHLIGTERGLGVNLSGEVKAVEDMTLDTQGNIVHRAPLSADEMQIQANALENSGEVLANRINIKTTKDLVSSGADAAIQATESIRLEAQTLKNQEDAKLLSQNGEVTLITDSLTNQGTIAGYTLTVTTDTLNNTGENSQIFAAEQLTLTTTGDLRNDDQASIASDKALTITAQGQLDNLTGAIESLATLDITASSLSNTGKIQSQNDALTLTTGQVDNQGTIAGKGITINATELINSTANGKIYSMDAMVLDIDGNITNEDGALVHANADLTLDAEGNLINTNSVIESKTAATINSQNLTNTGQFLVQNNALTITTGQVDNQGLLAGKGITINATELRNRTTNGQIYSTDSATLNVQGNMDNKDGAIIHADTEGDIRVTGKLTNTDSHIEAVNDLTLLSQAFENDVSSTLLAQNGTLSIAIGKQEDDDTITVTGPLTNKGTLTGKKVTLTATAIHNDTSDSQISATGDATLTATQGEVSNTNGASIRANGLLTIEAETDLINTASQIESAQNLRLSARNIDNTSEALIRANDSITMDWQGALTNDNAKIEAQNNIQTTQATQSTEGEDIVENPRSGSLTNQSSGYITALNGNLDLTLGSLINHGSIGANQVYLNTNSLLNTGSSGAIVANEHLDLYSTGNINNESGAVLYSLGSGYLETANTLTNSSARIETSGDLTILAENLLNKKDFFEVRSVNDSKVEIYEEDYSGVEVNDINIVNIEIVNTLIYEYILKDSSQSYIISGEDIDIKSNVDNYYSNIISNGNLEHNLGYLNNISYVADNINELTVNLINYYKYKDIDEIIYYYDYDQNADFVKGYVNSFDRANSDIKTGQVVLASATFTAGGNITGQAKSVSNIGSADSVSSTSMNGDLDSTVTDPNTSVINSRRDAIFNDLNVGSFVQSALYSASDNPDSGYLIQSNPLFTNYKTFISSDYMLNKMLGDEQGRTGKTASRLGDGLLEQNLVREQILSYTGFQTLPDQVDIESAYATLMDNALDEYEALQLTVGVELSDEQVAQLKQPIVWMVTETVQTDSGPQQALVPKVYLPNTDDLVLRPDGALIAANSIDIQVDGDLVNSGAIVATADLSLSGDNLTNSGSLSAGNNTNLNATNDINNSGSMTADGTLSLVAGGNITSETQNQTISTQSGIFSNTQTLVGDTASLQGGTINLVAGNDISLTGSEMSADEEILAQAGNNFISQASSIRALNQLSISAANDITLSSVKNTAVSSGRGRNASSVTHQVNSLAGSTIQLSAGNNLTSEASSIKAANQLSLSAGNDITLSSVKNTTSSSGYRRNASSVTHQVNSLAGSNIQLSAGNRFTSEGAQLAAQEDLTLAANNIDLLAVKDTKDAYSFVGGGGNSTEKRSHNESITGTDLSAGGALTLVSQNDIFSKGSTLSSGEDLTLAAGGDVVLTTETAHNSSYQQVKKKKSGMFGSKRSTTTTSSESLTNQGTNLSSGGDLTIASGVDILLAGSKASADGDISVQAAGDIQLLSAVDQSSQRYQKQKKGTFKVKAKDQGFIKQTAVTSDLIGGGNISLDSGSNITLEGATLAANDTLSIGAEAVTQNASGQYVNNKGELAGNVTVTTQALESSEWSESSSSFRGVFKDLVKGVAAVAAAATSGLIHGEIKVGESDATRTDTLTQQTTTLAAADLDLTAQQDLTLIGAQVAVSDTANLTAQNVTIDAAQERTVTSTSHTDQTVSGEGASFSSEKGELTLASVTETDRTERTTTTANTWAGSNLQAGNLNIKADKNVAIIASDVSVQNDASIEGENVLIGGREDSYDTTNDSITKTKTLTVGVKNAYADTYLAVRALDQAKDAVKDAKAAYEEAKQKVDEGKLPKSDLDFYKANLAVATANVASATTAVYASGAAAAAAASTSAGTGFYATAGVTTQTDTTSTTTSQTQWKGSNLQVGGNTRLTSDNNLNIEGSNINTAGQLALDASNINISAGKNTYTENTESHSEGGGISVSIQPTTTSYSGSINASQSRSDYQATDYVNSQIGAGSLVSNSDDLTIKGGNVSADDVNITTGSLTVESLQNTSSGSSTSAGFSVSASLGGSDEGWEGNNDDPSKSPAGSGVTGGGVNASKGNSEKAWVAQQSGITGGQVKITAKDTSLTGALLASTNAQGEDNGQLTLTTDTLRVTDIKDTDTNQNIGLGYSVSGLATGETPDNTDPDTKDPMDPSQSIYSASFNGHDKQQTTKATIGLGNVTVGGSNIDDQAQFADLNRDITNSQEITKDLERGGLDANLTVDNRMLSIKGWEDIANDVEKTNELAGDGANALGMTGVTKFLYDINDPQVAEQLQGREEAALDALIDAGVDPKIAKSIMTNPNLYQAAGNILNNEKAIFDGKGLDSPEIKTDPLTNSSNINSEGSYVITSGLHSNPAEQILLGVDEVRDFVVTLPAEEANAAMLAMSVLTGGVIKTVIDVGKDALMSEAIGETLNDLQKNVASAAAAGVQDVDIDTHQWYMEAEGRAGSESGHSTSLQQGAEFALEVLGIGAGLFGIKKASSHGGETDVGSADSYQYSGGNPTVYKDDYSPDSVSDRTIDSRNYYGYQEAGDYEGSFKRPQVDDHKLSNIVDDVYKGDLHSTYEGTGSTADAARWEYRNGELLNGSDHLNNKGPQVIIRLEKWLKNNPNASASDRHAAGEMLKDMRNAIKGELNQ